MLDRFKNNENIVFVEKDGAVIIQFTNFMKYSDIMVHGFTTRIGGVSTGECQTLNLGFNRNDTRENVLENYKRVARVLGINYENMVFSNQIHDNKIKPVEENDRGKGILRESDILRYDGLITDKKEVVLVTFYADCVPVLLFDPVKKVIASSHSGWRGTVKEIAAETVGKMVYNYNCNIENIEAAIGPSIGKCCFETGEDVYCEFIETLEWSKDFCRNTSSDKYHIDLQSVIEKTLTNTGMREEKILKSNICTKCNTDIFFSYRGDMGKTGSMAAIMQLK